MDENQTQTKNRIQALLSGTVRTQDPVLNGLIHRINKELETGNALKAKIDELKKEITASERDLLRLEGSVNACLSLLRELDSAPENTAPTIQNVAEA